MELGGRQVQARDRGPWKQKGSGKGGGWGFLSCRWSGFTRQSHRGHTQPPNGKMRGCIQQKKVPSFLETGQHSDMAASHFLAHSPGPAGGKLSVAAISRETPPSVPQTPVRSVRRGVLQ